MPLAYKVREVSTDSITVDYANGSWAVVPIESGMSRDGIEARIREFAGLRTRYANPIEVPFKVGDSGDVLSDQELRAKSQEEAAATRYTYAELRQRFYPSIGDQLDAAYWARNGKPERLQEIDARIATVKEVLPKDMEPVTNQQVLARTQALRPDPSAVVQAANGMSMEQLIEHLES